MRVFCPWIGYYWTFTQLPRSQRCSCSSSKAFWSCAEAALHAGSLVSLALHMTHSTFRMGGCTGRLRHRTKPTLTITNELRLKRTEWWGKMFGQSKTCHLHTWDDAEGKTQNCSLPRPPPPLWAILLRCSDTQHRAVRASRSVSRTI